MGSRAAKNTQLSQGVTIITQKWRVDPHNANSVLNLNFNEGAPLQTLLISSEAKDPIDILSQDAAALRRSEYAEVDWARILELPSY